MKALILAAGEDTRLQPLTWHRPQAMLTVGGRPLLEHAIGFIRRHKVTQIAINLHRKPQSIVRYFGDGRRFGVSITYSHEPELLGSAGAAKRLEWFFDSPFLVLYCGVLADFDLERLIREHDARNALATIVLYEADDPTQCGIVQLADDGRVLRFVEKPAREAVFSNLANAGIYYLSPALLRHVPRDRPHDFGQDLFPKLLSRGIRIDGYSPCGYILDVGSPERLAMAETDFRTGRFTSSAIVQPRSMTQGIPLASC
jgi:NDP-sugar pyrophosphorylase family protein